MPATGLRVLLIPDVTLFISFRLLPILHRAGFQVDVLCVEGDPLAHSRYTATAIQQPNPAAQFQWLKRALRQSPSPWSAIIVTCEPFVQQLAANGDAALLQNWQPGLLDPLVRDFCMSKFGLTAARAKWNLPIPESRVCQNKTEIEAFGESVRWPIIVKPPQSSGGGGVLKLESPEEIRSAPEEIQFPILAQKYIHGRRGTTEMFCFQGRCLAWLASYILKTTHGPYGPSTAREFLPLPGHQSLIDELAQFTRFEGFCGFDWIEETGTGQIYLLEFHPRATSGVRFGSACGVDFSEAVAVWSGKAADSITPEVQPAGNRVLAHYFTVDLFRCFRQRDWAGLKAWLPGSGACHDVYWDDLPLFFAWVFSRFRAVFLGQRQLPGYTPETKPCADEQATQTT